MENDTVEPPVLRSSTRQLDALPNPDASESSVLKTKLEPEFLDTNLEGDNTFGLINFVPQDEKLSTDSKCSGCVPSKCCTYITHEIDTPRTIREFDALVWKLAHANVQLFKEEGSWYLLVNTVCQNLLPSGGCGIYDTRPMICREHTNDFCEYDSPAEEGFDLFFDCYDTLDAYCRKRFKHWDKRFNNPRL
ncbi:MAG: YkgJ family cysteine cluster protein [Pseudomonadales bacterium]|nr:YkgJ family cysteine cluster protein [Pseudomonadales bacterium]